jgi:uncharacterized protein with HEPN domain
MAGKTPRLYLEHIREAIALIEQHVHGRQRQDFDREPMLRQAIERNIEIISEASRRLPAGMKTRHPSVPWRDIAAIGNILRHEYPSVDRDIVWRVATEDIRPLAAAVDALLAETQRKSAEMSPHDASGCRRAGRRDCHRRVERRLVAQPRGDPAPGPRPGPGARSATPARPARVVLRDGAASPRAGCAGPPSHAAVAEAARRGPGDTRCNARPPSRSRSARLARISRSG